MAEIFNSINTNPAVTGSVNKNNNPGGAVYDSTRDLITVPHWGVKDFINEKARWQKGIDTLGIDPAYCYFKLFFNFDSLYGLFGGIMNSFAGNIETSAKNSAYQYLTNLIKGGRTNVAELEDRRRMLIRFTNTLNYISSKAPWFFEEVSNINEGLKVDLKNLTKERKLTIKCKQDAIDMRLTTLFDMYKFVCYDVVNCKEVIPENLRKFDLQLVIFNAPIRYYQTSIKSLTGKKAAYKSLYDDDYTNRMSFKMITFKNCEFDINSIVSGPDTMNNSTAFNVEYSFDIKYDRAYEHNLNEWMQIFFGNNEILWDENDYNASVGNPHKQDKVNSAYDNRMTALKHAANHIYYYNPNSSTYKSIIDASEDVIDNAMRMISENSGSGFAMRAAIEGVNDLADEANDKWNNSDFKNSSFYQNFIR